MQATGVQPLGELPKVINKFAPVEQNPAPERVKLPSPPRLKAGGLEGLMLVLSNTAKPDDEPPRINDEPVLRYSAESKKNAAPPSVTKVASSLPSGKPM